MSFGSNAFGWPYFGQDYAGANLPSPITAYTMQARGIIKAQVMILGATSLGTTALFDDTVHIFDDPTVLFGNVVIAVPLIRLKVQSRQPNARIKILS